MVIDAAIDAPVDVMIDATEGAEVIPGQVTVTLTSVADIYLRTGASPNENTNDRDYFIVDGDIVATGLVRFDLSSIPGTATVASATLMLYVDGDEGMAENVYQMLEAWDEASATSNQRATGMAWLAAGAAPPSRGATAISTFTPATPNVTVNATLMTAVVQSWVMAPATNFGVAIATTNSDGARFAARERSVAAQRPQLRIVYTP